METIAITPEAVEEVKKIYPQIRSHLEKYMKDRNFTMSNSQIFIFLTYVPSALAISADKKVDEKELKILDKIARSIDANALDLNLVELLSFAPEPMGVILNEEFNLKIGCELLYISRNMDKYENDFIQAVKLLLKFDKNPQADTSMTKTFSRFMDQIIESSLALDKEKELAKVQSFKQKLGIA